jgi:hypothetical protein
MSWATPDRVPDMSRHIDQAAAAAGRDPGEIRRVYNLMGGRITDGPVTGVLQGPPEHWVETLSGFAQGLGFDTFVLWPAEDHRAQVERFAREVAPALRSRPATSTTA